MDCSEVRQQCQRFLDGELDSATSTAVDTHLSVCSACANLINSERTFHRFVKSSLLRTSTAAAPAALRQRVLFRLNEPREATPSAFPPNKGGEDGAAAPVASRTIRVIPDAMREHAWRRGRPAHGLIGMAAAVLLILTGIVAYQSYCIDGHCALVMAAEREHERVTAGAQEIWGVSDDPQQLTRLINEKIKFAGLPDLTDCRLRPRACGPVNVAGARGTFVDFVDCQCRNERLTLMIVDAPALPQAPEIEGLRATTYAEHTVLAWRSAKDGLLYMIVTRLPFREARELADLTRK